MLKGRRRLLEFFADGQNADIFAGPLRDIETVLVPSTRHYEVFKVVLRQRNESDAMQAERFTLRLFF